MGAKSKKGSEFERWFCKALSLWWSDGERADLYWRTAGSGGRATNRGKKGKSTAGAYGDIAATSHEGAPLLDLFTLEIKRGYSKCSIQDLLDKSEGAAEQEYEGWIKQAQESARLAGSTSWAVVSRRDKRRASIMLPAETFAALRDAARLNALFLDKIELMTKPSHESVIRVILLRLDDFLTWVTPDAVVAVVQAAAKAKGGAGC